MPRYVGSYNWEGEIHKMWTHVKDMGKAHRMFVAKLSKILGISYYRLRCYFGGNKDNYNIKEE